MIDFEDLPTTVSPDPRMQQHALAAFATAKRAEPFAWGVNDCCLFVADWVLAATGTDPALEYRGTYSTAQQAYTVLAAFGVGDIESAATASFGAPIGPAYATVGDIVLLDLDGRATLGVCNGGTALGPGANGLAVAGMEQCTQAWRLPRA